MIALLLAAQVAAASPLATPPKDCRHNGRMLAVAPNAGEAPRASKLSELPTANMELTVNRMVDGCVVPAIVRYDVERRLVTPPATRAGALVNRR